MKEKRNELHIGSCIKSEVERQGKTTVWLAAQLGYTRTSLYRLYKSGTIDTGILVRICRIMDFNFFSLYQL